MSDSSVERIRALRALEILDSDPDPSFDRVTASAARIFKTPVALISFVDTDRVWFKSHFGLAISEVPFVAGLCTGTVESQDVYLVEDALTDPRTCEHPLVKGEFGLRFYVAAPLRLPSGVAIGGLSVVDFKSRSFSNAQKLLLKDMAAGVVDLLELHRLKLDVRKKERELCLTRRAKRFFDDLTDNIPAQVAFWNKDFRCEFASEGYVKWYGMERDALIGSQLSQLLNAEDFSNRLPYLKGILMGENQAFEAWITRKIDNSLRRVFIQYMAHFDEVNEVDGFFIIFSDITELVQTKIALRDTEYYLKSAFENAPVGMTLLGLDVSSGFLKVNRALCNFLGYSEGELLNKTIADISYPEDGSRNLDLLKDLVAGKIPDFSMEKRYIHKKGHVVWGWLHVCLVRNSAGQPMHFNGQIVDITERKRLEEAYRQAQKMEVVGRLAGGVAHDFNNLLTAMMMSLEEFTSRNAIQETESLEELRVLGARGAQLTRQLLEFARQQPMKMGRLELNGLIKHLMLLLRRLIGDSIEIDFISDSPEFWVEADPAMMDQMIMNLCLNAQDAMPNGGCLLIKTESHEFKKGSAELKGERREGQFVCLTVSDTGTGIEDRAIPHIFEPFYTTKPTGKGTGLGLASVFGNVHQHQGWLEVSSKLGHGSDFQIYLPACAASSMPNLLPPKVVTENLINQKTTILLVEDHDILRRGCTRILEKMNYSVIAARDGQEALEIWKQSGQKIDLLITDMMMPNGVSGLQLARFLKEQKPTLKAILVSGFSEVLNQETDKGYQPTFLAKPFGPTELTDLVTQTLLSGKG